MDKILLGHGSGGKLMHALIREHFGPAFGIAGSGDAAFITAPSARLAYTTDSYVVSPLFFPGGNIGDLAICGTVNDLAVSGAQPLCLTAGFIIEEGFPLSDLTAVIRTMAEQAGKAGTRIVAGDTKVVDRGKADGLFINTSGIGVISEGVEISAARIRPGDAVVLSGELGNHGISILAERNKLSFQPPVRSDTRSLNSLVASMLKATLDIHFMRDPTRGGLATTLKEAALESGLCVRIRENAIPVPQPVQGACSMLGLDPLYIANEGILVAVVGADAAGAVLSVMQGHPDGRSAVVIGTVEEAPTGMVLLDTAIGGSRIVDMLPGEMLPRIC